VAAIDAIHSHLERGDLHDGLVFDAVRVPLIETGEAVKALPAELLGREPALPWAQIAGMRDRLAHRYFDISHAIPVATVSGGTGRRIGPCFAPSRPAPSSPSGSASAPPRTGWVTPPRP
jgi:hypothetical protein